MLAESEIGRAVGVHTCVNPLSVPDFGTVEMAWVWTKVKGLGASMLDEYRCLPWLSGLVMRCGAGVGETGKVES